MERNMMQKCDKLRLELEQLSTMSNSFDALSEYRKWWDKQDIESESNDGWPMDFCFEYKNIQAFAGYWQGKLPL